MGPLKRPSKSIECVNSIAGAMAAIVLDQLAALTNERYQQRAERLLGLCRRTPSSGVRRGLRLGGGSFASPSACGDHRAAG
jgi:hypothetical protein